MLRCVSRYVAFELLLESDGWIAADVLVRLRPGYACWSRVTQMGLSVFGHARRSGGLALAGECFGVMPMWLVHTLLPTTVLSHDIVHVHCRDSSSRS